MALFQIDIVGLPAVQRAFDVLPFAIQRKVLKPALESGAHFLMSALRSAAPVDTGALRDHLRVRALRMRSKYGIGFMVLTGKRSELGIPERTVRGSPRGYYPASIEYGWHPVGRGQVGSKRSRREDRRKGKGSGIFYDAWVRLKAAEFGTARTAANPWMSETFHSMKGQIVAVVGEAISRTLPEVVEARIEADRDAAARTPGGEFPMQEAA